MIWLLRRLTSHTTTAVTPPPVVTPPPPPVAPPLSPTPTARVPQLMLSWSDNRGKTFSNEHWATSGPIGSYTQRVIWRRLGSFWARQGRIFRIVQTDPIKTCWVEAYVQAPDEGGR